LDAPGYISLGEWRRAFGGRVNILAGAVVDFRRTSQLTDLEYHADNKSQMRMMPNLGPKVEQYSKLLKSQHREVREGTLSNALGCDLPSSLRPTGERGEVFRPLRDQNGHEIEWSSIEDPWNAQMALDVFLSEAPDRIIDDLRRLGEDNPEEAPEIRVFRKRVAHRTLQRLRGR
jgi:hypothetical protein